ncbi:hypothetical protein EUTSA_v10017497mg [Eutrema salsugineum]|uniref:Uncharacterized protein n=1 Tax=Eutrema salsugineum TaxID=72664 RepID=V4M7P3_EUTSA|nr:hypothetical protein EUTSA_v10017497mg [Eutrema salsugineum]
MSEHSWFLAISVSTILVEDYLEFGNKKTGWLKMGNFHHLHISLHKYVLGSVYVIEFIKLCSLVSDKVVWMSNC